MNKELTNEVVKLSVLEKLDLIQELKRMIYKQNCEEIVSNLDIIDQDHFKSYLANLKTLEVDVEAGDDDAMSLMLDMNLLINGGYTEKNWEMAKSSFLKWFFQYT